MTCLFFSFSSLFLFCCVSSFVLHDWNVSLTFPSFHLSTFVSVLLVNDLILIYSFSSVLLEILFLLRNNISIAYVVYGCRQIYIHECVHALVLVVLLFIFFFFLLFFSQGSLVVSFIKKPLIKSERTFNNTKTYNNQLAT